MTAPLLLVEDDPKLVDLVSSFLDSHGYEVVVCRRGDEAVDRVFDVRPSLVLLDLMLPGLDGMEVCRRIRERGFEGAVVMMTARGDPLDEILGLRVGADDYLRKPVRPQVLLARVQAILRRIAPVSERLVRGRLVLDLASRRTELDGQTLSLTTAEFDLLALLAEHAGEVMTRDQLSEHLRGVTWDGVDRTIDLRISRLRKKLGDVDATSIKSVRGTGYLLVPTL